MESVLCFSLLLYTACFAVWHIGDTSNEGEVFFTKAENDRNFPRAYGMSSFRFKRVFSASGDERLEKGDSIGMMHGNSCEERLMIQLNFTASDMATVASQDSVSIMPYGNMSTCDP